MTTGDGKNEGQQGPRRIEVTDRMRNRYIATIMGIAIVLIVVMVYL